MEMINWLLNRLGYMPRLEWQIKEAELRHREDSLFDRQRQLAEREASLSEDREQFNRMIQFTERRRQL